MYKVKLFKIKSTHDNLRTDTIEGTCGDLPKLGEDFRMYGEGLLVVDGFRFVRTTTVKSIIWDDDNQVCLFKTNNSTYVLFLKDEENKQFSS